MSRTWNRYIYIVNLLLRVGGKNNATLVFPEQIKNRSHVTTSNGPEGPNFY